MKPTAIVYTSNTGHTRQYALLLGEQVGLPVYSLEEANSHLSGGSPVIYLGWIHASHVKGYSAAARRFAVCAVCGVGLCDTGIDRARVKGMDKLLLSMLTKGLASQKQRSAQDDRMLELLNKDESYVSPENLAEVVQWYKAQHI